MFQFQPDITGLLIFFLTQVQSQEQIELINLTSDDMQKHSVTSSIYANPRT